ncbi:MAG: hypothetical protein ACLFPY_08920 [Desulfonatronovibrio sp.]
MLKKLLFIFLVHVIVLGSLWIWRESKDHDASLESRDKYLPGDAASLVINKADSSDMEILLCINADKLAQVLTEQEVAVSLPVQIVNQAAFSPDKPDKDMARTCCQINLNQSDCECIPAAGINE